MMFRGVLAALVGSAAADKLNGSYHGGVPLIIDIDCDFDGSTKAHIDVNVKVGGKRFNCAAEDIAETDSQITFPSTGSAGDCLGDGVREDSKDPSKYMIIKNNDGTLTFKSDGYPALKLKKQSLGVESSSVTLASFGPSDATLRTWKETNDPVMGGKSSGTFTVNSGFGTMEGTVANVPSLKAPGFINAEAKGTYEDVSSCTGIELDVRATSNPDPYTGWRFSFGNDKSSCRQFFARGYHASFTPPSGSNFGKVQIPFTDFTNCWSDSTGEAIKTCADDASVCPTASRLANLESMQVWAEGAVGDVKIDIKSVGAYGCGKLSNAAATPTLVTFDGAKETTFKFTELNDPVMGGKSTGTWSLGAGFGTLDGEVVDVPSLSAPGFIKAAADGKFPDISSAFGGNLVLNVRTSTPDYAGYRVTFVSGATSGNFACAAGGSLPFSRGCFKAKFSVPAGDDFVQVKIPFTDFSDKWSSATGEPTTTCKDSADVCPTASKLSKITRVEFWGEGANGKLHLDVQSVMAEDAAGNRMQIV